MNLRYVPAETCEKSRNAKLLKCLVAKPFCANFPHLGMLYCINIYQNFGFTSADIQFFELKHLFEKLANILIDNRICGFKNISFAICQIGESGLNVYILRFGKHWHKANVEHSAMTYPIVIIAIAFHKPEIGFELIGVLIFSEVALEIHRPQMTVFQSIRPNLKLYYKSNPENATIENQLLTKWNPVQF